jgi:hypothetical protein
MIVKKPSSKKSRPVVSSASALVASILAVPLIAVPGNAWVPRGAGAGSSLAASPTAQPVNPPLKFSSVYVKIAERFAIVGLDNTHPVYKNARGEYFYLDPSTGDMKFLSSDFYQKFSSTASALNGMPVKTLRLDGSKYGGRVSLIGIDARGNVVQKNSRGERFYLNPINGDIVFVK